MKKILITRVGNPTIFLEYIHFKPQTDLENGIGGVILLLQLINL